MDFFLLKLKKHIVIINKKIWLKFFLCVFFIFGFQFKYVIIKYDFLILFVYS